MKKTKDVAIFMSHEKKSDETKRQKQRSAVRVFFLFWAPYERKGRRRGERGSHFGVVHNSKIQKKKSAVSTLYRPLVYHRWHRTCTSKKSGVREKKGVLGVLALTAAVTPAMPALAS
jgi:hypothetical protein